jgi:hypothetical protein
MRIGANDDCVLRIESFRIYTRFPVAFRLQAQGKDRTSYHVHEDQLELVARGARSADRALLPLEST